MYCIKIKLKNLLLSRLDDRCKRPKADLNLIIFNTKTFIYNETQSNVFLLY